MTSMRFRLAFLLIPFFALPAFGACSNESEGQPCDPNASNGGNDDCQNGLVCKSGLTNANGARCCPQDLTKATTPECTQNNATLGDANPTPPVDASSSDGDAAGSPDSEAGTASDAAGQ